MIQRSLAKKRSGEGGFTLIELLIVIVILGILSAIVVLAIGGLKNTSQTQACSSEAGTIETAQDAYFASTGNATNYGSGAQLLSAGLLKAAPTRFTVTGGAGTYSITGTGVCAGTNRSFGP
jgi:prepilin-type N-terminal cleavage/methylation domain-containing protein